MHLQAQEGLMSTFRTGWRSRSAVAYGLSLLLFAFYISMYFGGQYGLPDLWQPLAEAVGLRSKWFVYGLVYTVWMLIGAAWYLRQHGNSRYNQARIGMNVAVQVVLGFTLPFVMPLFGGTEYYFSYFWPLKYDYLYPHTMWSLPWYLALYGVVMAVFTAPLAAVFFGKRWYCSWVCGCGGLANTFGDPWRHLTSSSTASWRFEKYAIHAVLGLAVVSTGVIAMHQMGMGEGTLLVPIAQQTKIWYGFVVGSILSGVIGTAVYPVLGPRIWCRNFCPMAALLGMSQKLGRFRIRVKKDMCISCGNCTTYCEMGIDVRAYAQRNQSFTRSSCVGCGMCAHVCPRGVLRLENGAWEQAEDKQLQGLSIIDY